MLRWLKWCGFWTLLGVVSSAQYYFADQRFGSRPHSWWRALEANLTFWYLWGLLSPVVAWLGRRFQVNRANFGRHFLIHLGASLDLALVHLVAAVAFAAALSAARGEPSSFAQTLVDNFTMFYHWNVLIYWAILATVHAFDYHGVLEERRALATGAAGAGAASTGVAAKDGDERERRAPAERLLVADDGRSFFVRTAQVEWIEASRNYVRLHAGEQIHTLRTTLAALETRLDPEQFCRVNRSVLVNLDRVREVQPWFHGDAIVILESGARVSLSRRYRDRLLGTAGT
jgi:LytTr DNA-binding domain-containing protein